MEPGMILENLQHDIRLAWRGLYRAKAFSGAAILTLGLGIAGTTVMFTLIQGVLLRPLPVREQAQLIVAWKELRSSGFAHYPFGDVEIEAVGEASQLLEMVAGVDANGVGPEVISEDGVSSYVKGALVTGGFFQVLGVEPILGRVLTRADDVEGAENVIVISNGLWQGRYGGSRDVIGRRVTLAEQRFTIVGVMPPDVDYPSGVEMWRTTHSVGTSGPFGDAARREVDLVARLRPGVTIEQATIEITALTRRLESDAPPGVPRGLIPVVRSFEEVVVGNVRSTMFALMAAVGLVLLIASANVANLLLMRGEGRRAELAVREALGAGRGRIVRQLLAESLVLTLVAAAVGLVATWWSLRGLMTLLPDGLPRVESVRIDATVVSFTVVVALVTSLVAGLAPALSLSRADLVSQLRTGGRGVTGSAARHGRRALVVAQVALAVTIVSAAGLLTRSVLHLQAVDMGLAADRLVFVELALPQGKYADRARHAQFLDQAVSQLEAVPAIAAATPVNVTPFSGEGGWDVPRFTAEGQSPERAATNPSLNLESVYPNYFQTFEVAVVRGRAFTAADREGTLDVAIVSEDVAARTWAGEDPIGKRLKMGGPDSRDKWRTLVGVAAPTRYRELARPRATVYLPAAQFLITAQMLVLRTAAPLDLVASLARDRIKAVDQDVHVMRVASFTRMLDGPLARPRFNAFLLSIFGVAALLLATIGLYAVMAAYVRQRDREIALRVALGATAANVRRLVLGEAVWLAGLGAAIGLAGAAGATRMVRAMLFEIDALDPSTLFGAALLLIAASALASYAPVRRATRVDGVAMLRN
jgi:putative ABC transport system permease protein